jgi:phosphatidylserine decarboxylase
MFKIHKEGTWPTLLLILILLLINIPVAVFSNSLAVKVSVQMVSLLGVIINLNFFRKPSRRFFPDERSVISPADGQVMVVEKVTEKEYFRDERIQVSVFMSIWDVHVNWFPVSGTIVYRKYHPGRYLVARLPKSSEENERSTTVVRMENGTEILIRQIAGAVARRIISRGEKDQQVSQGDELGFIRYGSRVDLLLPPDAKVYVQPGDRASGCLTQIARLK